MKFWESNEYDIVEAFRLQGCDIFNYTDARKFLLIDYINKSTADRVIAYLICLKIVQQSREKWGPGLKRAYDIYFDNVQHYCSKNEDDPLEAVPVRIETVLRKDLSRTVTWLDSLLKQLKVDQSRITNMMTRISRMYAVLVLDRPEISYTQGYDRYGCAFLALLALFCQKGNLSMDFAEAMAYHLTAAALSIVPMAKLLQNQQKLTEHFTFLDKNLMNYNKPQFDRLQKGGASIILFGVRWELLLFADEHEADDIYRIWDQIFGRLEMYEEVIMSFTIAHICQVKIDDENAKVLESVVHFRDWKMGELVREANELLNHKRSIREEMCEICCPKLSRLHGYRVTMNF